MGRNRHQHVVSRGFQRFFTDSDQLLLIDKETSTYVPAGTRGIFVGKNFNSYFGNEGSSNELEDEWMRVESLTLPAVGRLGRGEEQPGDRQHAKVIAAIHIARSFAMEEAHHRASEQTAEETGRRLAVDPNLLAVFEQDYGRPPTPGEIEGIVDRHMNSLVEQRALFINFMTRLHNFALERFKDLHVQILVAPRGWGFVLGDCPVIVASKSLLRLMSKGQIALGDADFFYMPISTGRCITFFSHNPEPDAVLDPATCQKLNLLSWRAASRYVACDPRLDPGRLLGRTLTPKTNACQKRS